MLLFVPLRVLKRITFIGWAVDFVKLEERRRFVWRNDNLHCSSGDHLHLLLNLGRHSPCCTYTYFDSFLPESISQAIECETTAGTLPMEDHSGRPLPAIDRSTRLKILIVWLAG